MKRSLFIYVLLVALAPLLLAVSPFVRTDGEPQVQGPLSVYNGFNLKTGVCTLSDDLLVDGGDIGVTGDTDLLQLGVDSLTVNGDGECTGSLDVGVDLETGGALVVGTTATVTGDIIVDGGEIGVTGDLDLLQLASGALTINGTGEFSGSLDADSLETTTTLVVGTTATVDGMSTFNGNLNIEHAGATADSKKIFFYGDTGGQSQIGSIYVSQDVGIGAPGLVIAVPNIATGVETPLFALLSTVFGFAGDNTVDIGSTGAFRPKDIYLAGNLDAQSGNILASGNITAETALLVDTGTIGVTGDTDLLQPSANALIINGVTSMNGIVNLGHTANDNDSFLLRLISDNSGDDFYGGLYVNQDEELVIGAPSMVDGTFDDVIRINPGYMIFDVDSQTDIGETGGNRPKNIYTGGNVQIEHAGGDANSYKLVLVGHRTAGDESQTSSFRTAWGLDPYMVMAAPSATGVETDVIHLDTNSLRCAADGGLDLGATGANRFANIFISGNFDAEAGTVTAQGGLIADGGNITAAVGNITATAGDLVAGDDVFDVLGDVRLIYPVVSAADPDEPFDCTAAVLGRQIIVDDTDDGTNQVVCICLGVDDVITYEWQRADDNATICPSLP